VLAGQKEGGVTGFFQQAGGYLGGGLASLPGLATQISPTIDGLADWAGQNRQWLYGAVNNQVKDVPILRDLMPKVFGVTEFGAQYASGGIKGLGSMVGGIAQMVTNPVDTLKGLYTMAEHIPTFGGVGIGLNPLKMLSATGDVLFNGADPKQRYERVFNPALSQQDDGQFWQGAWNGATQPHQKAWNEGRPAEAIGRGIFDIAMLGLGMRQLGKTLAGKPPATQPPGTVFTPPPQTTGTLPGVNQPPKPTLPTVLPPTNGQPFTGRPVVPPAAPVRATAPVRLLSAAEMQKVVADLKAATANTGNVFRVTGQRISVNGQINIHPDRLLQLQTENPRAFQDLLRSTKALEEVGGDVRRLSPEDKTLVDKLSSSGGQRLRFNYQLNRQVDDFLGLHNQKQNPLFQNMGDDDRARLFDIVNERPRQLPKDPRQVQALNLEEQQAFQYALSQKPKSVYEFVEQMQMYKAVIAAENRSRLDSYNAAITRILRENGVPNGENGLPNIKSLPAKQQTKIREQASQEIFSHAFDGERAASREAYIQTVESAGVKDSLGQVNPQMQARVSQIYQQKLQQFQGRTGVVRIDPNLSPDMTTQIVQELNETGNVRFRSETAGVYHTQKHGRELVPSELRAGKTDVDNYLASASETIRNPTSPPKVTLDQEGNRIVIFERQIKDEAGKVISTGKAIVRVTRDGEMNLSTYMP
jgi:hypothetical protein